MVEGSRVSCLVPGGISGGTKELPSTCVCVNAHTLTCFSLSFPIQTIPMDSLDFLTVVVELFTWHLATPEQEFYRNKVKIVNPLNFGMTNWYIVNYTIFHD